MNCNSAQGSQAEHDSHKQDDSNCQILDIDSSTPWTLIEPGLRNTALALHLATFRLFGPVQFSLNTYNNSRIADYNR